VKLRHFMIVVAALLLGTLHAFAAERLPYESKTFQAALASGKPILVHITAPWCPECRAQKPIVAALARQPEFKKLTIFDVDFDTQKAALRELRVHSQSTLIVFKGKAEVGRAVGITQLLTIKTLMEKAL